MRHIWRESSRASLATGIGVLALAALVALTASARDVGAAPPAATRVTGAPLGSCSVFPAPPASLSPRAPSLPTEAAWNQNIAKAPRAGDSAKVIAYIDAHGGDAIHPDFGSPREYGFPYAVVGAGAKKLPIHYTAYGSESSPGPFPIPANAPVEGGAHAEGDRHVLVVDRSTCKLFELYDAHYLGKPKPHWDADAGVEWNLRSAALRPDGWTSADAAGLPIFPGLVRYEEAAAGHVDHAIRVTMDSTRNAWIHPASHCAGRHRLRRRAADGPAPAAEEGLPARQDGDGRPRDRHRDEGIRADRRRQRIELVHLRHQRQSLGRRRTRRAEGDPRQRLRSRQIFCRRPRLLTTRPAPPSIRQILPSVARMMKETPSPIAPRTIRKMRKATIRIGISSTFKGQRN